MRACDVNDRTETPAELSSAPRRRRWTALAVLAAVVSVLPVIAGAALNATGKSRSAGMPATVTATAAAIAHANAVYSAATPAAGRSAAVASATAAARAGA